ncbi:hypothetical protein GJ496_003891 [Pomphorhynchus laevis]|nr:hypothetical protein GJ496_003891 [Pomphorhynchus laevis]
MSYAPNVRPYRPIRGRRPSNQGSHPDSAKRYKHDDSLMGQSSNQMFQQSDEVDGYGDRYNAPSGVDQENNVLLFTIVNAIHPITADVMKTICNPYGKILRIVIFRKNGVQALVEFDALTSARTAREKLQGADIYSGCCTLRIDFAKSKRLNVIRNDADNYDCELPEDGHQLNPMPRSEPLLPSTNINTSASMMDNGSGGRINHGGGSYPVSAYQQPQHQAQNQYDMYPDPAFDPNYNRPVRYDPNYPNSYHHSPRAAMMHNPHSRFQRMDSPYQQMHPSPRGHYGPSPGHRPNMPPSMGGVQQMRPMSHQSGYNDQIVLLVNNLNPEKMNCDYLFNFLCVYGNVYRIKFLKSREGCAMAQMNQSEALTVFLRQINNTYLFGSKISISISKQEYLEPVIKPFTLPDGSLSYTDYENSRNNRYGDPRSASRNRPVAPSNTIYYFNTPPGYTEEDVCKIFDAVGGVRPIKIKNFQSKKAPEEGSIKGITGLAQWNVISDAANTLVLCNNYPINHPASKWPYLFKVTFSSAPIPTGAICPQQFSSDTQIDNQFGSDDVNHRQNDDWSRRDNSNRSDHYANRNNDDNSRSHQRDEPNSNGNNAGAQSTSNENNDSNSSAKKDSSSPNEPQK